MPHCDCHERVDCRVPWDCPLHGRLDPRPLPDSSHIDEIPEFVEDDDRCMHDGCPEFGPCLFVSRPRSVPPTGEW